MVQNPVQALVRAEAACCLFVTATCAYDEHRRPLLSDQRMRLQDHYHRKPAEQKVASRALQLRLNESLNGRLNERLSKVRLDCGQYAELRLLVGMLESPPSCAGSHR